MKIRKNDTVLIIKGKERGKKGKVRKALPKENKLIIDGLNMIKRHSRTSGQARQAGIIELEAPINVANVIFVCNKCGKPARIGHRILEDGKKVRVCRVCSEVID